MTTKIKSRLFQMLIPEIKRLTKARYTHSEIIEKLKDDYSVEFKLSTYRRYLMRYRDLITEDNATDNHKNDYQNPIEKENPLHLINNNDNSIDSIKKTKTAIDNDEKSDIITTGNDSAELSLTQKALSYSPSETRSKIDDKVKNLMRTSYGK